MTNLSLLSDILFLDFEINILDLIGTIVAIVGATLALIQWRKGNDYKRAELVQNLITKVRDDADIAHIMDILDWDKNLTYDSHFHLKGEPDETKLFIQVDKTLSHFSYICYLHERRCLKNRDMYHFEYELRRLVDNEHIANYLYSLYHWSHSLGTSCSFEYLIRYARKKKYINKKDFKWLEPQGRYECFLYIHNSYYREKHTK